MMIIDCRVAPSLHLVCTLSAPCADCCAVCAAAAEPGPLDSRAAPPREARAPRAAGRLSASGVEVLRRLVFELGYFFGAGRGRRGLASAIEHCGLCPNGNGRCGDRPNAVTRAEREPGRCQNVASHEVKR